MNTKAITLQKAKLKMLWRESIYKELLAAKEICKEAVSAKEINKAKYKYDIAVLDYQAASL